MSWYEEHEDEYLNEEIYSEYCCGCNRLFYEDELERLPFKNGLWCMECAVYEYEYQWFDSEEEDDILESEYDYDLERVEVSCA